MQTIRIQARLDSTTLSLPELAPLVGRTVEIVVSERAADSVMEALRSSPSGAGAEAFDDECAPISRLA